jgi:hypothetical protein
MEAIFNSVTTYARDIQKTADFHRRFFGFLGTGEVVEGLIVLTSPNGGAGITILQATKCLQVKTESID